MIVISMCSEKMSEREFVDPILRITGGERAHYLDPGLEEKAKKHDRIILSGTAVMDFEYLNHLGRLEFLTGIGKPVLGICAGAQVLVSLAGGKPREEHLFGKHLVETKKENPLAGGRFPAFFLFTRLFTGGGFETLAESEGLPVLLRKGNLWASYFHPEVMNPDVLERFGEL